MTRIINIVSGKGGVGKTTLTSNLAYALTELGEDVIAIDTNLTTPHLGLHLGIHLAPNTLHDVLRGDTNLSDAIYPHPSGFKILPASMSINDLTGVDIGKLPEITSKLSGTTDYVLMDCAPGLGREAVSSIKAADELILVTSPELPSVADALKTLKIAEKVGKKILGVVVNRVRGKWYELTKWEIEETLNLPVLVEIPEDANVSKSVTIKMPLVEYDSFSPAAIEIRRLAHQLTGREFGFEKSKLSILDRFIKWVTE